MVNVYVAAEWQLLYNRYYRKPELYPMSWKHVYLARIKVVVAPFGGPVAIIRDDSKIVQLHAEFALCKLRLFSSSDGHLIGQSCYVVQDGTVYRYDVHANLIEPNLSLGKECFEEGVLCGPLQEMVFSREVVSGGGAGSSGNGEGAKVGGGNVFDEGGAKRYMRGCNVLDDDAEQGSEGVW